MSRFNYLLTKLEELYPNDQWLKDFRLFENDEVFAPKVRAYDEALSVLDEASWSIFEPKLLLSFKCTISRRGKQNFFNHLNEAIAYNYLLKCGLNCVRFIEETNESKTPDILFGEESKYYCEVKTISESMAQIDRYDGDDLIDGGVYRVLGEAFFNKLESTITTAIDQFPVKREGNIVFLVVHFDDFTNMYFDSYEEQISMFLRGKYPNSLVHIRSNIFERYSINHGELPNNLIQPTAKAAAD